MHHNFQQYPPATPGSSGTQNQKTAKETPALPTTASEHVATLN